ncbi:MAG: exodeoxyribonuclease VII large subunit [Roseivirga sp.]|nr:exodeoxyribonuclease VII large subunit [Roseivirga sp.]
MAHLSLFEFNSLVKKTLESSLEPHYWIVAEISEMRLNQKGHCYMEVVEKEGNFVSAKIRANIWAYTYRNLSGWFEAITHSPLQPGIKILFKASINFHEVYGMSLTIKDIDPNFTLGERTKKRKEIIDRLVKEGVYEMNQSLVLPLVPQHVAVISSETAAGYGDFLDQLNNNSRGFVFQTTLFQALMQGDQADESMVNALLNIHESIEQFDLVVIIRGGGAQVDLDCFDQYDLAAHIAQFPIPVITGIGHERDETIADLVAHTKMKTPTAVAEFLISGLERIDDRLNESIYRMERAALNLVQLESFRLQAVSNKLQLSAKSEFNLAKEKISRLKLSLRFSSLEMLKIDDLKLDKLKVPLQRVAKHRLVNMKGKLENLEKSLALVNPESILKRGYSITRVNGQLIGKQPIKKGDIMETITNSQQVSSEIREIK